MAIRSVALPLLSGAALLLGYAAFAWLRPRPRESQSARSSLDVQPLAANLERVPEALVVAPDDAALSHDESQSARSSHLRALFLARLTQALSPFHNPPAQLASVQVSR